MSPRPAHVIDSAACVLVTGGAGFIGSHLVEALVPRVERIVVLDNLTTGTRANFDAEWAEGRVELIEGSTTDAELVDRLVGEGGPGFSPPAARGGAVVGS